MAVQWLTMSQQVMGQWDLGCIAERPAGEGGAPPLCSTWEVYICTLHLHLALHPVLGSSAADRQGTAGESPAEGAEIRGDT